MRATSGGPWAGFVVAWDDMACVVITRRVMYTLTEGIVGVNINYYTDNEVGSFCTIVGY
jgi:hypothetical protein